MGEGRQAPDHEWMRGRSHEREAPTLAGRVCIVTGATRGIGKATAHELARRDATVVIVARDPARGSLTAAEVRRETGNARVGFVAGDLGSLDSVRAAAREIASRFPAVHVLINNAGVSLARREVSRDGFEMTLAVNYLGPFLFTQLLEPVLRAGAPSRIVNVTSAFERLGRINFADLQRERRYDGDRVYMQSKLAVVLFTYELAERLAGSGITANCVDPGLVATDLLHERWWWRTRLLAPLWRAVFLTPEQGARASIFAAVSEDLEGVTGKCVDRRGRPTRTSRRSYDREARERLWTAAEQMVTRGA